MKKHKETDEFEDDYEAEDEEEEEPAKEKVRPQIPKLNPRPQKETYSAYHYPETNGLMNNETNKVITTDLWEALAMIKNDLEEIKKGVG